MKKLFTAINWLLPKVVCALCLFSFSSAYAQLAINITAPTSGQTLAANANYTITVSTSGSPSKVTYWVDNWTWIGESSIAPYSLTYNFPLTNGAHVIKARVTGTNNATVDATDRSFTIGTADTQAPSVPGGLSSASVTQTGFTLNWTASTDNVGVTGYDIYDGATKLNSANVTATTYAVTGLTCGTSHSMTVRAKDAAGNVSAGSTALNVNTSACSGGGSSTTIPATIEAENYSAMSGIQTETTTDTGGGLNVGYMEPNDWMDYSINVPSAGTYTLNLRVASPNTGTQIAVRIGSTTLATVNVPNTGGWQTWQTATTTVSLSAGVQTIRITNAGSATGYLWNLNWIQFSGGSTPPPTGYTAVPATIEAESYNAMQGVQLETTSDAGGGQNVGYIDATDWMDYNITAATAGTFTLNLRVASLNGGGQIAVQRSGTTLATVNVPNTGGWQTWQTISTTVSLNAGNQTIRLLANTGGYNLNYIQFVAGGATGDTQAPTVPSNVTTSALTQTSATVSWTASTDNVGVTGYDVYRNGSFLASTTSTSYSATGLACATAYSFYVRAKDAAGNQSANSSTVNATTSACSGGGDGGMQLGTNFWDPSWSPSTDYFVANPSFTAGSNPWNATFLNEIGIYKCFRFMDFGHVNNSNVTSWSQRTQPTANQTDGNANPNGIAFEWMIDLCNRKNADLWVCLPHKTDLNYWTQLATLINNTLNSNLKVYVEYSNETWNGGFTQFQYTIDQGVAQGLPGGNQYYQGGAYSVWQSVKIFKAFQDVFGAAAMGSRVIRVCSASGNYDIADQAFASILSSSTWNPSAQKVDMFAIAPYVNSGDGAASNAQANFRAEIDATFTDRILTAETIANKYAMQLGCYEGGQHLLTNANVWSSNPAIYDEYTYMLNKWKPKFKLFNHYTHLGTWNSGGAWGAKQSTTSTLAESHKYRAMVNWVAANPPGLIAATNQKTITTASMISQNNSGIENTPINVQPYPNPFVSSVKINLGDDIVSNAVVNVYEMSESGKLVYANSYSNTSGVVELNLGNLKSGHYVLRLTTDKKVRIFKIIKK